MSLRFPSGSVTPSRRDEKALACVDVDERHPEVAAERLDDLGCLVLAQQPVVDEHAGELVADRLVHEKRGDGRVDTARERRRTRADPPPARGCAPSPPRSPPPPSKRAAHPRRGRGSSSAPPCHAACARPRGGTGRRRGCRSGSSNAAIGVERRARDNAAPAAARDGVAMAHPADLLGRAGR